MILFCRVSTDHGKVWKVVEFKVEIFNAFKVLKMTIDIEKYGKNLGKL